MIINDTKDMIKKDKRGPITFPDDTHTDSMKYMKGIRSNKNDRNNLQ